MEKTTDLDIIRKRPRLFTWGPVHKIHDIGRYTIVEHTYEHAVGGSELSYHVYVDGKDTARGAHTLERALLCAIAWGAMGSNDADDAARFAAKLMELK